MKKLIAVIFAFIVFAAINSQAAPKKFLIFSAKLGNGHEAAAKGITQGLLAREPGATVETVDVYEFSKLPMMKTVGAYIYNKMVAYMPELWDRVYENDAVSTQHMTSILERDRSLFNEKEILEYIRREKPDEIICTFNRAAESIAALKAQGLLPGIRITWIHTDYVVLPYYELLAKSMDMTFLAHPTLVNDFIHDGVPANKIMATGMPVNPLARVPLAPADRLNLFASLELNPDVQTVTLMSGGEGVGDFAEIIKSISSSTDVPLQIIAICAKNEKNYDALQALVANHELSAKIKLVPLKGFLDNSRVLDIIKASDVYVTKSGGISPTEAFVIGKPLVIMDINGGQERYNTAIMTEQKLALGARTESDVGAAVSRLINEPELRAEMLAAQKIAADNIDLDRIAQYLLNLPINPIQHAEELARLEVGRAHPVPRNTQMQKISCLEWLELGARMVTGVRRSN